MGSCVVIALPASNDRTFYGMSLARWVEVI